MKKIIVLLLLVTGQVLKAQSNFEGLVEMKITLAGSPTSSTSKMYFSNLGHRSEMEMRMPQMAAPFRIVTLFKKDNPDSIFSLNDTYKTYSVKAMKKNATAPKLENEYTVKVLGNEKILGYNCVHSLITNKTSNIEMWTTKEIIDYTAYEKIQESNKSMQSSSFAKELKDAHAEGFPLKTMSKDDKGKGSMTMEVVKVEKKKIDESLFSVPKDYKKTAAPSMGGMMQELRQSTEDAVKTETEDDIKRKIENAERDVMNGNIPVPPAAPNK